MAKFYTGKGDDGTTGLLGEGRVAKHDLRMEAIGSVDEASAALGLARSQVALPENRDRLLDLQRQLYRAMTELAATPETAARFLGIDSDVLSRLEGEIDALQARVIIPREFIIPGDTPGGAALDLARTIIRRAERRISELMARGDVTNPYLLSYFNRLSSYLFLLELSETAVSGRDHPTLAKEK